MVTLTLRRSRRWCGSHPTHKVFLHFFQKDFFKSAPAVFSSCTCIPKVHFIKRNGASNHFLNEMSDFREEEALNVKKAVWCLIKS